MIEWGCSILSESEVGMEKYILRTLNLTPEDVQSIDPVPSKNGHSDYLITLKVKDHFCPKCGCLTNRVKDYRIQKVKAKIFNDGSTTVFYKSRRYLCKECGKAFKERTTLIEDKKTISQNTAASILEDLKPYNSTLNVKENQEENIKNQTENHYRKTHRIEPLKTNWGEITPI